ncbi:hypothetical protein NE237_030430 [Protea cynaroides]|uniref:Uncharacterized protein n=1 Tax=Protea cynaroides TaxID=273540 RepID=A0A9Q0JX75_9MAGN|nr:hypothetical protein NE237_030430 [Protea cynaroides]
MRHMLNFSWICTCQKEMTCRRKKLVEKVSYFSIGETLYDTELPSSGICEALHYQGVYAHGDVLLNIYQVLNKANEVAVEPKWPKKFSYGSEVLGTYNLPF